MNKRVLSALIINILIVIFTLSITASYYFYSNNPLVLNGFESYKFFTTDSNILAAISALVLIPFEINILRGKREAVPHAAIVFKYVGMTAVMLTLVTVMTLLLPVYGAEFLLLGTSFYMHLAGPLAALVTFLFLETDSKISLPESLLTLLPSLIYGIVYLTNVVIIGEANGGWIDFYTFNKGGYWYITMPVALGVTYIIAAVTRLIHNKIAAKSQLQKPVKKSGRFENSAFNPETQYAVIRASICTGEKVAGFRNKNNGSFTEVMLIRSPKDEEEFKKTYGVDELDVEY